MLLTLKNPDKNCIPERNTEVSNYTFQNSKSGIFIMEIWKDVPDYEGFYQVSSLGRVRSLDRWMWHYCNDFVIRRGRLLKGSIITRGYIGCTLIKHYKRSPKRTHRLVALAFIPNPLNKAEINHKDCNKQNNRVENLEWCTRLENSAHARKHNLYEHKPSRKMKKCKLTNIQKNEVKLLRAKGMYYKDIKEIYNVSTATICNICIHQ